MIFVFKRCYVEFGNVRYKIIKEKFMKLDKGEFYSEGGSSG